VTTTLNDESLMLAVRNGDTHQLGILFKRHYPPLFDFFCRMTGNRAVSEDLVQEVFFRILKYRATFRSGNRFTTWMYQIARNARIDFFKNRRLDAEFEEETIAGPPDVPSESSPGRDLERRQEAQHVRNALLMLSEDKRELLILARYRELKYEEIADMLGIDAGAVKVRVHRAVKELRDVYLKISGEKTPCSVKKFENNLRTI
jgi:RNA polymerase sigma-70 factor (ECF subfamily)